LGFYHGKKYFCQDSGTGNNWQKVWYIKLDKNTLAAYSEMLILDEKRAPCLLHMTSKLKQLKMPLSKCKKNSKSILCW